MTVTVESTPSAPHPVALTTTPPLALRPVTVAGATLPVPATVGSAS